MKRRGIITVLFFFFVTLLFFRPVITRGAVPIPLNLLVSYYSPWRYDGYKEANKAMGFDNVRQMLPYKQFSKQSIVNGAAPLWNPYIFAGSPHIATLQPAFFYPGTLLDVLFPLHISWTIMVILQPIIAGILTYIFLRALNVSRMAALIGGISFAFSGWMITWWEEFLIVTHSIIWLPLALYGSLLLWKQKRIGFLWLTLALTLSIFASFTQSTLYLCITVFAWNIYLWWQHKNQRIANILSHPIFLILLSGVSAVLLTAIQWVPTLETYLLSPRATTDAAYIFSGHLLPLTQLVTLFAPDYWGNPGTYNAFGLTGFYHERIIYAGLVPLVLALIALFHVKNKELTFWKYFTLITFSMVFAIPTSWAWHTLHIPLLSAMQPTRIMMIVTFGASVLASYGFDEYTKNKQKRLLLLPLGIIGIIAAAGWGFLGWALIQTRLCPNALPFTCRTFSRTEFNELLNYGDVTLRNLLLPSASLFFLALTLFIFHRKRTLLFVGVIAIHLLTMGYFANKYLYFSDTKNMYPITPVISAVRERMGYDRVWGYGNAAIESNIFSYFNIAVPEGYAPFFPGEFGELIGAVAHDGNIQTDIDRSDVTLKHADEVEKMTDNPFRLRMMSLLGVKYIMETKNGVGKDRQKMNGRFPSDLFSLSWENEHWRLWEYKQSLPRAFLTTNVIIATSTATYASALFDPSFSLTGSIVLDTKPAILLPTNNKTALSTTSALIQSYEPNTVTIKTTHDTNAMLFLSDSYYPGWNTYIDEKQTPVYRADYAFRAVGVPAGNHTVEFRYEPVSWKLGIVGSFTGMVLCIILWAVDKYIFTNRQLG